MQGIEATDIETTKMPRVEAAGMPQNDSFARMNAAAKRRYQSRGAIFTPDKSSNAPTEDEAGAAMPVNKMSNRIRPIDE